MGQAYAAKHPIVVGGHPATNIAIGGPGCQVNIGGIALPAGGSINNSNVTINSTNTNTNTIVVCK